MPFINNSYLGSRSYQTYETSALRLQSRNHNYDTIMDSSNYRRQASIPKATVTQIIQDKEVPHYLNPPQDDDKIPLITAYPIYEHEIEQPPHGSICKKFCDALSSLIKLSPTHPPHEVLQNE